jgi:hypothetical protein
MSDTYVPYPDHHDHRQATRRGNGWPRHRSRRRTRRKGRAKKERETSP